jgi:predicted ATPase
MAKIEIHNFGPIKTASLNVFRVTVFTGNQGSGKSTVAKLISTFSWMEKMLVRGDYSVNDFTEDDFIQKRLAYHRLSEYMKDTTELLYEGEAWFIGYKNGRLMFAEVTDSNYTMPQIMYVTAERCIVATVGNAAKLKGISGALNEFITEYINARHSMPDLVKLPINDTFAGYDKVRDTLYIHGRDYQVNLIDAASGFQSLVPLYLVSQHLCDSVTSVKNSELMSSDERRRFEKQFKEITNDPNLTEEQKRIARSSLGRKYNKSAFINIVEEPELNLYPSAQKQFLYELLKFNNTIHENEAEPQNKVIITTHSPYLINFLSIAIHGKELLGRIMQSEKKEALKEELASIVPLEALTAIDDVSIFQLDETTGSIEKLASPYGIPSDDNLLNKILGQGNIDFNALLDIEEKL